MSNKYKIPDDSTPMASEPAVAYNVHGTFRVPVKPLPVQESIPLTEEMKASLHKAEKDLADGNCLTEEKFQTRFAKWTSIHA